MTGSGETLITASSCWRGLPGLTCSENSRNQRTVGVGIGIGVAIGVDIEQHRDDSDCDCDPDTDSDPDSKLHDNEPFHASPDVPQGA